MAAVDMPVLYPLYNDPHALYSATLCLSLFCASHITLPFARHCAHVSRAEFKSRPRSF